MSRHGFATLVAVRTSAILVVFALIAGCFAAAQTEAWEGSGQPGVPKFYAESRQILLEATVWQQTHANVSWVPKDTLKRNPLGKDFWTMYPPARGLSAKDFHVFEDGIEQSINYFKEVDSPTADLTNKWYFLPDMRGTWGFLMDSTSPVLISPEAKYLIGYVPRALNSGECRTLRVTVKSSYVWANRDQYCTSREVPLPDENLGSTKLGTKMRKLARSNNEGSIRVSLQAHIFSSSGVLSLVGEASPMKGAQESPDTEYRYVIEVHDSKAPATVQVTVGLPRFRNWDDPCPRDKPALRVLGLVYKSNGELATQFADTCACESSSNALTPALQHPGLWHSEMKIPDRFDTQIGLAPGDYELDVVVSIGSDMGHARMPLHVEPLDSQHLMISDLVVAGVVRYAGWVLSDAARVTPAPVTPSPLVSKDSQYFPDSDSVSALRKHTPLYLYFEIYESELQEGQANPVHYRWRITDQKTGSVIMRSEPMSAAQWMVPGSRVIPIGLKLGMENLQKGRYRLEVQASDAAGHETEWRTAKFQIQ